MSTIKERLLEDIQRHADSKGRVSLTIDQLRKRHGLSGHDLAKNLEQIPEVRVRWRAGISGAEMANVRLNRGAVNDRKLAPPQSRLSLNQQVLDWLGEQPSDDGWVKVMPKQIREEMGVEGNAVSVAVSDLARQGRLELRKDGQRIVAMRPAESPTWRPVTQTRADGQPVGNAPAEVYRAPTEVPPTPWLDKYAAARRFAKLAPSDNLYLEVTFEQNPLAEEAITLRDALRKALGIEARP